jgi:hypothetical protein
MGADVVTDYGYDEINRLTRETTCDYLNAYYYDGGGNRTKFVHMNAVYSKDGNGRIVSMLTKASQSTQGLTKINYHANYTERTGSWKDLLAVPTRASKSLRRRCSGYDLRLPQLCVFVNPVAEICARVEMARSSSHSRSPSGLSIA